MFTLEESALLGYMMRVVAWLVVCAMIGGGCWIGVHWMRSHHHALTFHHVHHA
ncbi:MAG TPA: hypothetical protein VEL51_17345 [Vicinamibacterales bacterium]|nr:hypothetical protein [Vicinamibacterales bacterium]